MRFSLSALAFAASLACVNAQDLTGIPDCALTCFAAAIQPSGCTITDTKCQCTTGAASITASLTACVPSKCSTDDIAKIQPAVEAICKKAGVALSSVSAATATATATGKTNSTSNVTRTASPSTASGTSPAQSTGGAVANVAGFGMLALGVVAAFGL